MTQKALFVAKNKRVREVILSLLKIEYPEPVDEKVLYYALDDLGLTCLRHDFEAQMFYLCEKGYVERVEKNINSINIVLYRLTAFGMDIIEGTKKDGGIKVGEKNI